MPLSLNEIKDRALAFSREWEGERSERAEAQTFWNEFFTVFGVTRRRLASFEEPVRLAKTLFEKKGGKGGFIDLFWRGVLITEHKSLGLSLDSAYEQALGYFEGLSERDLPRYVIVSDFARLRLYDLDKKTQAEIHLQDLYKNIKLFGFIAGYKTQKIEAHDPVNIKAAERMGMLHDKLRASGYSGHALELLLVRLLFCLFAENTTLFEPQGAFREYIENSTKEDGSDLGQQLAILSQVLNKPENDRPNTLDEILAAFPYVNGKLFKETLEIPSCDRAMRELLLDCCSLDWGRISPAIFGALFQCVMDEEGSAVRRNLGAHYTSEENILKVIKPLFLDALWAEFESSKRSPKKLLEFHKKIADLKFFDPACGCGNFLVIAYRELRKLELEILRSARSTGHMHIDFFKFVQIDVDNFYGIEIEEFPAQIAQVALWLTDHQMNMIISEEFGQYFRRLPLIHSATIACGNALQMDWNSVISAEDVAYILGNPPFVGKRYQSADQRVDMARVFEGVKGAAVLDYVAAWYMKAIKYVCGASNLAREHVKIAFVSTNSITQGEQVGILWYELLRLGVKIHFAHRTFKWTNEARGMATVHCVIIGFALHDTNNKTIFDYPDITSAPHALSVVNINPYLVDASDLVLTSRRLPICSVPEISFGSMPNDDGNLILSDAEKDDLLRSEPGAMKWLRPYVGAEEYLNGSKRWCLWLVNISPTELRSLPRISQRVEAVRKHRLKSTRKETRDLADYPTLFGEMRQPLGRYIAVPKTSSERRAYIPIDFYQASTVASTELFTVESGNLYILGVLSSLMHMSWVRAVAGRLESRYRYSNKIVYNNFPWPQDLSDKQRQAVEKAAQGVLDARAGYPESSLADLYDPIAMPPDLRHAHQDLDRAVDAAYGKRSFASNAERVAFLFELYQQYTSMLPAVKAAKTRRRNDRR